MIKMKQSFTLVLLMITMGSFAQNSSQLKLWYNQPAQKWEREALPIGNGRIGAMLYGGIKSERIQFNEQSLWSGDNNWDGAYETGDHGFGSYRNFGEITIDFNFPDTVFNQRISFLVADSECHTVRRPTARIDKSEVVDLGLRCTFADIYVNAGLDRFDCHEPFNVISKQSEVFRACCLRVAFYRPINDGLR